MSMHKAIARAWTDVDYKAKLKSDPHTALAEVGIEVPAGTTLKVVENSDNVHYLVLPVAPSQAGEISAAEMEKTVGGLGPIITVDC